MQRMPPPSSPLLVGEYLHILIRRSSLKCLSALQKLLPSGMCEMRKKSPLTGRHFDVKVFAIVKHGVLEVNTREIWRQENKVPILHGACKSMSMLYRY